MLSYISEPTLTTETNTKLYFLDFKQSLKNLVPSHNFGGCALNMLPHPKALVQTLTWVFWISEKNISLWEQMDTNHTSIMSPQHNKGFSFNLSHVCRIKNFLTKDQNGKHVFRPAFIHYILVDIFTLS